MRVTVDGEFTSAMGAAGGAATSFVVSEPGSQIPPTEPTPSQAPLLDRVLDAEIRRPPARAEMPKFRRPWWLRAKYIDIQPLLWSLKHRPDEWEDDDIYLRHKPSNHAVRIAEGWAYYRLNAQCSCSNHSRNISFRQRRQLRAGVMAFRIATNSLYLGGRHLDRQFSEHFV